MLKEQCDVHFQPPRVEPQPGRTSAWPNLSLASLNHRKLSEFGKTNKTLSLYFHIPFCQTMCTYCACNVVIRKNDDKYGNEYLRYLFKEIDLVADAIGSKKDPVIILYGT